MRAQADRRTNSSFVRYNSQDSLFYQAVLANALTTSIDTRYATTPVEYVEFGTTTITGNTGWGSATADARMLIARVNGNLTVNSGATLTATARKRGMVLLITGNLTVYGTVSMTARGASGVEGQRIYTVATSRGASVDIPAVGGAGGPAAFFSANNATTVLPGYNGTSGVSILSSGGGGSGNSFNYDWNPSGGTATSTSGKGSTGTSFSGGIGGGGAVCFNGTTSQQYAYGVNAVINGGAGGAYGVYDGGNSPSCGGGAGNPGGAAYGTGTVGGTGSGGLLVIFCLGHLLIETGGSITSRGSNGGAGIGTGGGSGGGIIIALGRNYINKGTISTAGGTGGVGTTFNAKKGNGGNGGNGYNLVGFL